MMTPMCSALAAAVDSALQNASDVISPINTLVIGLSGGLDSMLLLHMMSETSRQRHDWPALHAVHVHHGLQPQADDWQRFCEHQAAHRNVAFYAYKAKVQVRPRQSTEAVAREARYAHLFEHCRQHQGILLLGHHQDDLLETMLLQLKRGAGPKGLSGMADRHARDQVLLVRPWLEMTREALHREAQRVSLPWIEDPSNSDTHYDRNFLRHKVLPLLRQRWPSFSKTAARSARLCAEQEALLMEASESALARAINDDGQLLGEALSALSTGWQRQLLRLWVLRRAGIAASEAIIEQLRQWLDCREDAQPQLQVAGQSIYYWRRRYYMDTPVVWCKSKKLSAISWLLQRHDGCEWTVALDDGKPSNAEIVLSSASLHQRLFIEKHQLSKPIAQWLKQWGIPPWQRASTLWVTVESEVIALVLYNGEKISVDSRYPLLITAIES